MFNLYENVQIYCIEGFGGEGHIIEVRPHEHGNMYKVRMNGVKPGEGNYESIYHEGELT